ncbi:Odorant receptor 2a [Carabus blaptoides fortunei]
MDENRTYKRYVSKHFNFELYTMLRYIGQLNRPVTKREYPKSYFKVNITMLRLVADLNVFLSNLGIVLTHIVGAIKILNWCIQHKRILALMEVLQNDEFQYGSYGDFEPGLIAQKAKQKNVLFSTMYFWSCYLVLISGYVEPTYSLIFQPETLETLNLNGEMQFCWKLPFFSWMPFDHTTYLSCALAYVIQFFLLMYLSFMIIAVDALFMGIINYITAHLDIIQSALKTIRTRAIAILGRAGDREEILYDDEELNAAIQEQLRKATKYLQTVYSLCDAVEQIYSIQTLVQVMITLVVMCTCMYLLSTEEVGSKLFVVQVFYIVAIQYQLFLYCWFGNELTLAHSRIPYAVYECDWFSTSRSFKKSMLITIIRTQRILVLTVGNFTPLTLNTLVTIIRGSYSLFAVLQKTNTAEE